MSGCIVRRLERQKLAYRYKLQEKSSSSFRLKRESF